MSFDLSFDLFRLIRLGRFGRVIVTTKDGDRNMLRHEVFREMRMLDDLITNATATYEGEHYQYQDICAKWDGLCFVNDILNLDVLLDKVSMRS